MEKRKSKGQIELVFVVVLVVIGAVAVFSFLNMPLSKDTPDGAGISDETRLIKDSVINLVRTGIVEKIDKIYMQGGYSEPTDKSVQIGGYKVEILYDSGVIRDFNFKEELEKELEDYIKEELEDNNDFFGESVIFNLDNLDVKLTVIKGSILARVDLPTTINGNLIPQPYEITVDSDLYDIIAFSKDLISYQNSTRFFEMSILDSMVRTNRDSEFWTPFFDIVTGCENVFYKDKGMLLSSTEKVIKHTASHIIAEMDGGIDSEKLYIANIPTYGLDVAFSYPSWDLANNFRIYPDPVLSIPKRVSSISTYCVSSYNISYSFRYPIVVYVKDEHLNKWFRFVVMVSIDNNKPSDDWILDESVTNDDYYKSCKSDAKCPVRIAVVDEQSNPVVNAVVSFDKCVIGVTKNNGIVDGISPCFAGELKIRKGGMETFNKFMKSDDLKSVKIALFPERDLTINLFGVPIMPHNLKAGITGEYESYSVIDKPVPLGEFPGKYMIFLYIYPKNALAENNFLLHNTKNAELVNNIEFSGLPIGNYDITVTIMDNETGYVSGYLNTEFSSDGLDDELFLYLPIVAKDYPDYRKPKLSLYPNEIIKISKALEEAGIKAISKKGQMFS